MTTDNTYSVYRRPPFWWGKEDQARADISTMTLEEFARKWKCSLATVSTWKKRWGITGSAHSHVLSHNGSSHGPRPTVRLSNDTRAQPGASERVQVLLNMMAELESTYPGVAEHPSPATPVWTSLAKLLSAELKDASAAVVAGL